MIERLLPNLICPACGPGAETGLSMAVDPPGGLGCGRCGSSYPVRNGVLDFVGDEPDRVLSLAQRAMEFGPLIALYERYWRPLVTAPFSSLSWEMETSLRLLDLEPDHDVLDIACGPGNFTRLIASRLREGEVTGIDLSYPMLKKAVSMPAPRTSYFRVDVTKWVFRPESFHRVHCAGALHLFPRIQDVFHSIARSLKPGGVFVGATYIRAPGGVKRAVQDSVSRRSGFHWFEPQELADLAARAGFSGWRHETLRQGLVFRVTRSPRAG